MSDAGFYRKVIHITAEDSPNVRLAREEAKCGRVPSGRMIIPGVLSWHEYQKRRATWDPIRQSIGLDARFYEGAEVRLFPGMWLDAAETLYRTLQGNRRARGIGVDTAEGGDRTSFAAVDRLGMMGLVSTKTPDTSKIIPMLTSFVNATGCDWRDVTFDGGGGGKQIADTLRSQGKPVRIVRFNEGVSMEVRRGAARFTKKLDVWEDKAQFTNRRAQLYGTLSELLDPTNERRFAMIPSTLSEAADRLRHQLSVIPKLYGPEDELIIPPKRKKAGQKANPGGLKPLEELIGYSPDEADATVLAVDAMLFKESRPKVGVS